MSNGYDVINAKIQRSIDLKKQELELAEQEKRDAAHAIVKNTEIENSGPGSSATFDKIKNVKGTITTKVDDDDISIAKDDLESFMDNFTLSTSTQVVDKVKHMLNDGVVDGSEYNQILDLLNDITDISTRESLISQLEGLVGTQTVETESVQEIFNRLKQKAEENGEKLSSADDYAALWRQALEELKDIHTEDSTGITIFADLPLNFRMSIPSEDELSDGFETMLSQVHEAFSDVINNESFLTPDEKSDIIDKMFLSGITDENAIRNAIKTLDDNTDSIDDLWYTYYDKLKQSPEDADSFLSDTILVAIDELKSTVPEASDAIDSHFSYMLKHYNNKADEFKYSTDTVKFNNVFNAESFKEAANALKELAISGELSPEVLTSTETYRQLLVDTGLTAAEVAEKIRGIALTETSLSNIISQIQSHAQLLNTVNSEISNNGKISLDTLQSIAQQYPLLENYIIDYLSGVEGAEAELINKLNECYATDIENYNEYYRAKQENDETWWTDYVKNAGTWVDDLAAKYGIELENCRSYATTKAAILNELQETETELAKLENTKKALMEEHGNSWGEILFLRDNGTKYNLIKEKYNNLDKSYDTLIDDFNKSVEPVTTPPDFKKTNYTGGSSPTEDNTDYWKKEADDKYSLYKHELAMNYITEAEYYAKVDKLNKHYFANNEKYISEYRQYSEEVYKGLLSMQDKAISAIEKLRDLRVQMLKDEKEKTIKTNEEIIKTEKEKLDAIKKNIDARKEAIQLLKEESDHNKEMSEKNKAISDIQTQLDDIRYDNSRDAAVKRRKLQEELTNAQKDLDDYITDYEYNQALDALDKEAELAQESYDNLEKFYTDKNEALRAELDDEVELLRLAMNDINGMSDTLFTSMKNWALETTGDVQEVTNAWKEAYAALEQYNGINNPQGALDKLKANAGNNIATAADGVNSNGGNKTPIVANNNNNGAGNNPSGAIPFSTEKYLGNKSLLNKDTSIVDRLKYHDKASSYDARERLYKYWFGSGYSGTYDQNVNLIKKMKLNGYKKGIKKVNYDELAWTQENGDEMIIRPDGSILTPLPKGSGVIPANLTENLWDWGALNPTDFITPFSASSISNMQSSDDISISIGDININGTTNLSKSDLNEFRMGIVDDVFNTVRKNQARRGKI